MISFSDTMFRIYLILGIVYGCHAYPSGAPSSACSKMIPDHGVPPQNTSSPYVIILSSSNFTNQDNLTSEFKQFHTVLLKGSEISNAVKIWQLDQKRVHFIFFK